MESARLFRKKKLPYLITRHLCKSAHGKYWGSVHHISSLGAKLHQEVYLWGPAQGRYKTQRYRGSTLEVLFEKDTYKRNTICLRSYS